MELQATVINLLASDLAFLPHSGDVVSTVLGSCVSVVFYVPGSISMVSHSLLPSLKSYNGLCIDSCPSPCHNDLPTSSDFRYVTCSLKYMIGELKKRNIHPSQVHTSLIGGANVLQCREQEEGVGYKNVAMAREILNQNGFVIQREHTGGLVGRNLKFYSESNTIMLKIHGQKKEFELRNINDNQRDTTQEGLKKLMIEVQKLSR